MMASSSSVGGTLNSESSEIWNLLGGGGGGGPPLEVVEVVMEYLILLSSPLRKSSSSSSPTISRGWRKALPPPRGSLATITKVAWVEGCGRGGVRWQHLGALPPHPLLQLVEVQGGLGGAAPHPGEVARHPDIAVRPEDQG